MSPRVRICTHLYCGQLHAAPQKVSYNYTWMLSRLRIIIFSNVTCCFSFPSAISMEPSYYKNLGLICDEWLKMVKNCFEGFWDYMRLLYPLFDSSVMFLFYIYSFGTKNFYLELSWSFHISSSLAFAFICLLDTWMHERFSLLFLTFFYAFIKRGLGDQVVKCIVLIHMWWTIDTRAERFGVLF